MTSMWMVGVCMGLASGAEPAWQTSPDSDMRIVDDRVMGGVSRSRVEPAEEGFLYTGMLSRDSGGGFVSMRVADADLDVAGAEGIELIVRGDGRTYQLTARRSDIRLRAGSYRTRFDAPDTWTTVRLPFSAFGAMQMGQDVVGAPALDGALSSVDQLGILLTDGPEGRFELEVRCLRPYGKARPRKGDLPEAVAMMVQAIEIGVPLYNDGDAAGCRDVYQQLLQALSTRPELTDGEQVIVRQALDGAKGMGEEQAAWRLRYGIDAVMGGLMPALEASVTH